MSFSIDLIRQCELCFREDAPIILDGEEHSLNGRKVTKAKVLPCGHAFHADCIDKWAHENAFLACPVCDNSALDTKKYTYSAPREEVIQSIEEFLAALNLPRNQAPLPTFFIAPNGETFTSLTHKVIYATSAGQNHAVLGEQVFYVTVAGICQTDL